MVSIDIKDVISKQNNNFWIDSPREMAPIYTLGDSHRSWEDRRFGAHQLMFYIDDCSDIEDIGYKYGRVYAGNYTFGEAEVKMKYKNKDGTYFILLETRKMAISQITFSIIDGKIKMDEKRVQIPFFRPTED